jgi:hypothetical protein
MGFPRSKIADVDLAHPQMAKVFLARSGVSGARKVTGSSQRKIVMLAVPIDDYQATTLLEMGERRARQHLNNSGEF